LVLVAGCAAGADFETATIEIGDTELSVWVADTAEERRQGLRGVVDLPVDGMLFAWDFPTTATFGMRETLIPLDIWWFGLDGELIGMTEMQTCPDGDCVSYPAPGLVRWALETPQGNYEFELGDRLTTSVNS
jgi:uncharacterized membrane protein (UPF0127 family)